ncbi:L-2-amino-thiazoline-4-carboxylic acid hydrolase [Rhizobium tubonense]|uniref:2-amino-thiazoline-4-carboxylic acid hydrolase n=1 Tax=Rhizobium tubonense TaxID=484088 RepID=A0A2W4C6G7_9HYPH|nr:L-2-amino-thiazoline-4-carboxylic acid hydrolase [Rhizobium tubonense]PZM08601.1 2-amino-thiazoline-4-carboxylic acid hydrolase [Rhizobium tubonense]
MTVVYSNEPRDRDEIGILRKRTIEAGVIAPIYAELVAEFGETKAQMIIDKAIRKAATESAREFASKTQGGTSLQTFQELQSLWTQDDALEIKVLKATATEFEYDVLRCRYAETYKSMGIGNIGHLLSCNRDAVFCEGYDSRISMRRTQTLMGGANHCDFRYTFNEDGAGQE